MKTRHSFAICSLLLGSSALANAQFGREDEVPLMRPDERKTVDAQSADFNRALETIVKDAAGSTVEIWGKSRNTPRRLALGTVVGDGTHILTKWSEIESYADQLYIQGAAGEGAKAEIEGVFTGEDLALLSVPASAASSESITPAKFYPSDLSLGQFLTAAKPNGKPGAFGVVAVLERNLRETDQAHLGIMADQEYRGEGVRISNVQPEYGAADAGLQSGDVILKVNDRAISGLLELKNALSDKQPGEKVTLAIEAAGKERNVEVLLSNRPVFGQFSGDRLNQMERMGGDPNRVRSGFSRVVQSDMQIKADLIGGPVVDLQGRVVGITMARADRTRTYIMGSGAVMDLLKGKFDTVAEARKKNELKKQELAEQRRAMIPQMRAQGKPRDPERMKRHLSDMERLLDRMNNEMEALGPR
jgi:serine protease Do